MDISVDYYALLHVQPNAPAAVIKASYRTMMQKLNHHPDRGGDEGFARLLNEASRTLCDPKTRARYDALRQQFPKKSPAKRENSAEEDTQTWGEPGGAPGNTQTGSATNKSQGEDRSAFSALPAKPSCQFCNTPYPSGTPTTGSLYEEISRCTGCNGARTPIEQLSDSTDEELRRVHRQNHKTHATLYSQWPPQDIKDVTLIDFSTSGCALHTDEALPEEHIVMIETGMFNAICRVRYCHQQEQAEKFTLGVAFVTLDMSASPGSLLNATA